MLRKLIVAFLGHVDHGKTSIQDAIRESTVVEREAGKITQHVGASIVPQETIVRICGPLLGDTKLSIPGFLMIDTPGHQAFTNLRKRGGSIADIAVVVIDINEGFMPQTIESIDILKTSKTPFIVAANKIDIIPGYQSKPGFSVIKNIQMQQEKVVETIEKKTYEIVGRLSELGIQSERFDRIDDYTKQVGIVPISAKTREGLPELLMVLAGLAQKYLETGLQVDTRGPAKGTILEVKEEKGLGTTIDVIIFEGSLNINDTIVVGTLDEPLVTKVKALLEPMPLSEMRDKKSKFKRIKKVEAAAGVKISAQTFEGVIAGMPLRACAQEDIGKIKAEINKEIQEVLTKTDPEGIIVKADTLGSLEALVNLLRQEGIKIKKASIGNITKKDYVDAETNYEKDPMLAIILGFNVTYDQKEKPEKVGIIIENIIYKLIDEFKLWQEEQRKKGESRELDFITRPFKLEFLKNYVFRQSNPAIIGVEVLAGTAKSNKEIMNAKGHTLSRIRAMQHEKTSINEATKGMQIAVSLDRVTVGRQINEGDYFYSVIQEQEFIKLKKLAQYLAEDERKVLKEIAMIMREESPVWGV